MAAQLGRNGQKICELLRIDIDGGERSYRRTAEIGSARSWLEHVGDEPVRCEFHYSAVALGQVGLRNYELTLEEHGIALVPSVECLVPRRPT